MIPDVTIPVERFHRVLVDEIQKQRPTYLGNSFTVAEIYQILVPYRSHRDELGVEMNGDYEDALLRLLAGAGDLVVLESDDAKDRILRELQSKNPNTGLFREFAGAGVHLNPDSLPEGLREEAADHAEADDVPPTTAAAVDATPDTVPLPAEAQGVVAGEITPAPGDAPAESKASTRATYFDFETSSIESMESAASEPASSVDDTDDEDAVPAKANGAAPPQESDDSTPAISLVSATEASSAEPGAGFWKPGEHPVSTTTTADSAAVKAAAPQTAATTSAADCTWCDEALPERSDVNFCPQCGMSTNVVPCGSCRAEMEPAWKFCVACGAQA